MKIIFLGTGGAFTDYRDNYHNNVIVETTEGWVLIDCGSTAVQSLKELGIRPWEIAGVALTHMHGDHVGGLEQLIWESYYTGLLGPSWKSVTVWSPPSVLKDVAPYLSSCIDYYTSQDGTIKNTGSKDLIEEIPTTWFEFGGVQFRFHKTEHVVGNNFDKPSFGVYLKQGEKTAYYTSDTIFNPQCGLFNADVIFHDCTFGPKYLGTVHTHYEDLCSLPKDIKEKTYLMHYTKVPVDIDVSGAGFKGAVRRHQAFIL